MRVRKCEVSVVEGKRDALVGVLCEWNSNLKRLPFRPNRALSTDKLQIVRR